VIVTHDAEEAALLADEIVVIDAGRVLQAGTRREVFRAPGSPEVAALLGIANARRGVAVAGDLISSDGAQIRVAAGELPVGSEVVWCVRPERIALDPLGSYEAVLLDDVDLGSTRELTVALGQALELTVRTSATLELSVGAPLRLELAREDVAVWPLPGTHHQDERSLRGSALHPTG